MKDTIKLIEMDPTWMARTGGYAKDMTLRDHFAALVLQAEIHGPTAALAERAYRLADAMLKERNK
jgi:hypothetical protein